MKLRHFTVAMLVCTTMANIPLHAQNITTDEHLASAKQIKARIGNLDRIFTKAFHNTFFYDPSIEYTEVRTANFQETNDGLNATTLITTTTFDSAYLTEEEEQVFALNLQDSISYDKELSAQDIVARIESKVIIDNDFRRFLEMYTEYNDGILLEAFKHFLITIDLHSNSNLTMFMQISPFEFQGDHSIMKFDGLSSIYKLNESTLADGVGEMTFEIGKVVTTSKYYDDEIFIFKPFNLNYSLDENGVMSLDSSPMEIEAAIDNTVITMDSIHGSGRNIHFDDEAGMMLGNKEIVLKNIKFSNDVLNVPIVFNAITFTSNAEQNNQHFNLKGEFNVDIDGRTVARNVDVANVELKNIAFDASLINFSMPSLRALGYKLPILLLNEETELSERLLKDTVIDMVENDSTIEFNSIIKTDLGEASLMFNIAAKNNDVANINAWMAAIESEDPFEIINIIQSGFDFDIKLSISQDLVKALEIEQVIAMGVGYVVKDANHYTVHIANTDDGVKLNGNFMPLPSP